MRSLAALVLLLALWALLVAAQWVPRPRSRAELSVIVLLALGTLVAACAADVFVDIAELVVAKNATLQAFDERWHDIAVSERSPGATTFFVAMSAAGGPLVMAIVSCVAAATAFVTKRPRWALYLLTTAGGGGLLNLELKRHFARARPALSQMLRLGHGYSFPSGHTMESLVVLGGLTYLAFRILTTRWQKALVLAFGAAFVVSVAASRVYLGEHWISDVGAGASAGLLWLAMTTIGYESFRRIHLLRQTRSPRA